MAKVLLIGGDSFTGEYLKLALECAGLEVVPTTKKSSPDLPKWISCDISNRQEVVDLIAGVDPEYVVNLAGISFAAHPHPQELYTANLFGPENILFALDKAAGNIRKVILASTANIYGAPSKEIIDETTMPAPVNHYAGSKLAMEHMAATWFDRLPIIITRPFNYTGIGQSNKFLVPKIVDHFIKNENTIELGNTEIARDFSDVRDVAQAYVNLLRSDAHSCCVNICSGTLTSLSDIVCQCEMLTGKSIEIKVNPAFVRQNEIRRLRGTNNLLEGLAGSTEFRPIHETLRWMLLNA